ncbi:MAG TPA: hypothetical protein GXX19_00280 [Syntrophomonadaceae bacterium]|nr:hypothetical protein [Syntrophomonadaceae bacterium]
MCRATLAVDGIIGASRTGRLRVNSMHFQCRRSRRLGRHQQRNEKAVYPCWRSDLRRLLLALDEGAANGRRSETGI